MINRVDNSSTALEQARATPDQWLTLKQASDFLGVHYTTLRVWADNGDVPVFRTPGGHRRFSLADLRRFLEQRASQAILVNTGGLVDAALVRVRAEMERSSPTEMGWRAEMDDEMRRLKQERGRQLFGLAVSYVVKANQRQRILADGRALGFEYGREAASSAVSVAEAGRAVQFFRNHLITALSEHRASGGLDADDVRIQQLVNQFVDEVLFAVLDGYEQSTHRNRS